MIDTTTLWIIVSLVWAILFYLILGAAFIPYLGDKKKKVNILFTLFIIFFFKKIFDFIIFIDGSLSWMLTLNTVIEICLYLFLVYFLFENWEKTNTKISVLLITLGIISIIIGAIKDNEFFSIIDSIVGVIFSGIVGIFLLDYFVGGFKFTFRIKNRKFIYVLIGIVILISSFFVFMPTTDKAMTNELVIYNWDDYFGPTTISDFEEEFGINVTLYSHEDESMAYLDAVESYGKYDLIILSDTLIKKGISEDNLEIINKKNIPNYRFISDSSLDKSSDIGNQYSIPYLWGTTGLLLNTKYLPDEDSWGIFWNKKYQNKTAILASSIDAIPVVSKYIGIGVLPLNEANLKKAFSFLELQKINIRGALPMSDIIDLMVSEEIWAAEAFSGDVLVAIEGYPDLEYIIPYEGGVIWLDNFAIMKGAKNKAAAETFINYILRPEVSANITNYQSYATSNKAAEKYISPDILNNSAIYLDEASLRRVSYASEVEQPEEIVKLQDKLWEELYG
ncbi:MAG: spermidine/putrescine ABC transporter substrate-binding protein [Nanoarchaeota archaeon]|jgi:spermidine/putrescine transport system substrate-binding protein|nr:spermidine/putrescine ABC transporter substrate-binding protein [Nanoarchaeota archaeon]